MVKGVKGEVIMVIVMVSNHRGGFLFQYDEFILYLKKKKVSCHCRIMLPLIIMLIILG